MVSVKKISLMMLVTFGVISCGKGSHNMASAPQEEMLANAALSKETAEAADAEMNLDTGGLMETETNLRNWEQYVNNHEDLMLFWFDASQPGTLVGKKRYAVRYGVSTDGWEQSFVGGMNAFFITTYKDFSEFTISQWGKYHFSRHGRGEGRIAPPTNLDYARYVQENKDVAIWYGDMKRPGINGPGLYTKTYGHDTTSWEPIWLSQMNRWFRASRTDPGQFAIHLYGKFHYESYGIREGRKIFPNP